MESNLSSTNPDLEKEKTRKLSIKEGAFSTIMASIGESYITPFAIAIKSSNFQIGIISALSGLLSPLAQLRGSKLIERRSRVSLLVNFVSLQAMIWIPMIALALFYTTNLFVNYLPILLIIFYTLYAISGAIAGPAWFSLMGDIVSEKMRNSYFSKRNRVAGFVSLTTTLLSSFLLDFFKTKGYLLLGFSILFLVASISRTIAVFLFKKHHEPKLELPKEYYFTFRQFARKAPFNNFGKFTIFVSLIYFGTTIAGPFFTVYMLSSEQLGLSYIWFTMTIISSAVSSLLIIPVWARLSDRLGNKKLLHIGAIVVSIIPFFWLFNHSAIYLVLVPSVLSGIGWGAFNFAASNFIYDAVTPARRAICVAYYNTFIGIAIFIGSSLGGLIIEYVPINFMNKFLFIFLLSGILRITSLVILFPEIQEIKEEHKGKSLRAYLYLNGLVPVKTLVLDFFSSTGFFFFRKNNNISNSEKNDKLSINNN